MSEKYIELISRFFNLQNTQVYILWENIYNVLKRCIIQFVLMIYVMYNSLWFLMLRLFIFHLLDTVNPFIFLVGPA